jgi:hypothetical protein
MQRKLKDSGFSSLIPTAGAIWRMRGVGVFAHSITPFQASSPSLGASTAPPEAMELSSMIKLDGVADMSDISNTGSESAKGIVVSTTIRLEK